jgi:hypothetical protein
MVARQVGEDGDVEPAAGDALEHERVRGDLHRRGLRAVEHHLARSA